MRTLYNKARFYINSYANIIIRANKFAPGRFSFG